MLLLRERLFSLLYADVVRRWEDGEFSEEEMERKLDKLEGKTLRQLSAMLKRKKRKRGKQ